MNVLVFDFETSRHCGNLPWMPKAYPVSLCLKFNNELKTYIFNHQDVSIPTANLKEIQEYFNDADLIVAHNLKFDLHWLHHIGICTDRNRYYCTMVAQYLITGQAFGTVLSLADLSTHYHIPSKLDAVSDWWDSGYETDEVPLDVLIPYGEQDVLNCEAIFRKQIPLIKAQGQSKIVKLRCESLRVTQQIEANGMMLNTDMCEEMSGDYSCKISSLTDIVINIIKEQLPELRYININLGSNEHLSAILFGGTINYDGKVPGKREGTTKKGKLSVNTKGLGFTPREGTETKKQGYYQVDVGQLSELKAKPETAQFIVLNSIQELSKMEKMKGTYCDGLIEKNIDGLVHPSINETATRTGRYSSSNPNAQNMPREGTSPIKRMFVTRFTD